MTLSGTPSVSAGFRFPREVISVAVRWCLRDGLSCRDVEPSAMGAHARLRRPLPHQSPSLRGKAGQPGRPHPACPTPPGLTSPSRAPAPVRQAPRQPVRRTPNAPRRTLRRRIRRRPAAKPRAELPELPPASRRHQPPHHARRTVRQHAITIRDRAGLNQYSDGQLSGHFRSAARALPPSVISTARSLILTFAICIKNGLGLMGRQGEILLMAGGCESSYGHAPPTPWAFAPSRGARTNSALDEVVQRAMDREEGTYA